MSINATSEATNAFERIKNLVKHPGFDETNPNLVRSLIRNFAAHNPIHFHNSDGSGYEFVTDMVIKINATNPQLCLQIAKPLINFNGLNEDRIIKMKHCLQRLKDTDGMSKGVLEIATKGLEYKIEPKVDLDITNIQPDSLAIVSAFNNQITDSDAKSSEQEEQFESSSSNSNKATI